jgi:hypothetical protein
VKGRVAVILAGGLSMTPEVARKACESSAFVIAINDAWELALEADVLFAADPEWWWATPAASGFAGRKLVCGSGVPRAEQVPSRSLGVGSNSALQAAYWVSDLAERIVLCGVDLRDDELTHFHGRHNRSYVHAGKVSALKNPTAGTFERARGGWEAFAARQDIPLVINCSVRSALQCFQKMTLEQALA